MAFLIRDFVHVAPANRNRPVKRLRRGAATAFVDAESGHLISGYSYNTCLFTVASSEDYPAGRLYANETVYGPTSARHAGWLRTLVDERFKARFMQDESHEYRYHMLPPLAGDPADALRVPRGTSDRELVRICHGGQPLPTLHGDWHPSTTFGNPDGKLDCAYFHANRDWLDREHSLYHHGQLHNAQRIDRVLQYSAWLGEDPCGCASCVREYGSASRSR